MSNRYKQYFSTSEFAILCNVTKHTLFHYDEIGILKPEFTDKNGYRYYSMNQFFAYDIISILKEAGTPLKEIKEYFENQNTEHFLSILKEKQKCLDKEQKKIENMKKVLQNTINVTNYALHAVCGQPKIIECEEEYFIAVKNSQKDSEKTALSHISDLYKYCMKHNLTDFMPLGIILNKESLDTPGDDLFEKADYFYCKIDSPISSEWLYVKPKGRYALINHKGSYENMSASYEQLKDYIKGKKLTIIGNAYEYELLSYIADNNPDKYVMEISIQIA